MEVKKYAAIDIGSNGIRLLITNVIEKENAPPHYMKSSLVRVPIRLGADVFSYKKITEQNVDRMIDALTAFQLLMKVYGVEKYKACATSAMREANNGSDVAGIIAEKTGIQIAIIDGKKEAAIIASTNLADLIREDRSYLYVDVGGGSTEFTFFHEGKIRASRSFKIGTVRLGDIHTIEKMAGEQENWIKKYRPSNSPIELIGSGGNINKIFKMSGKKMGTPLTLSYLVKQFRYLKSLSYEDRIYELGLNQDRADVIIPAIQIYIRAMKWSNANLIHVPKIGLADGIIKGLHQGTLQ